MHNYSNGLVMIRVRSHGNAFPSPLLNNDRFTMLAFGRPVTICCYVKVNLSLCLTNSALRHEDAWGNGFIGPHFLDFGNGWRWVVSFTPRPHYPRGNSTRYPLDRRLGRSLSRSGRHGQVRVIDSSRTRNPTPLSSRPYPPTISTALPRHLQVHGSVFN
jgi:hypothetical protein